MSEAGYNEFLNYDPPYELDSHFEMPPRKLRMKMSKDPAYLPTTEGIRAPIPADYGIIRQEMEKRGATSRYGTQENPAFVNARTKYAPYFYTGMDQSQDSGSPQPASTSSASNEPSTVCNVCRNDLYNQYNLRIHQNTCNNGIANICPQCKKKCSDINAHLKMHMTEYWEGAFTPERNSSSESEIRGRTPGTKKLNN